MVLLVGLRGAVTVSVMVMFLFSSLVASANETREEERAYVAMPGFGLSNDSPSFAQFALREGDATIRIIVDDALAAHTEASVGFGSETYPFARAVTFCRSVQLSVPWWADEARVYVEPLGGSLSFDGGSAPEDVIQEVVESPGALVDGTPIDGTPVGDLVRDELENPPHLVPELPYGDDSTCPDSSHGATAGVITARIS